MAEKTLNIEGMNCLHCAMALKKSFNMVEGISEAEVELGKAKVIYDEGRVTDEDLRKAVERAGYKVRDY